MGQSPDGRFYSLTPSKYILIQGNADLKDGWVSPRIWTSEKTKLANPGDLIMSVRAPAGAMGKTAYTAVLGRGVASIAGNSFLFQLLSYRYETGYWSKISSGSTFDSINYLDLFNSKFSITSYPEQKIIGLFFDKIDSLITLHQRKFSAPPPAEIQ